MRAMWKLKFQGLPHEEDGRAHKEWKNKLHMPQAPQLSSFKASASHFPTTPPPYLQPAVRVQVVCAGLSFKLSTEVPSLAACGHETMHLSLESVGKGEKKIDTQRMKRYVVNLIFWRWEIPHHQP
jgi:hypothetical protein